MYLPDFIILNMVDDGCTAVKVYCDEELREEIATRFTEAFNEEYEKLMDLIEEEDGACYEKEENLNPFNGARFTDYGFFLSFGALAMYGDGYGDHISCHDAGEALKAALNTIKQKYPSIRYEGYVAYYWTDVNGGEICQYKLSSEKRMENDDVIYDFVGEALACDEIWDGLSEALEDADEKEFERIIRLFQAYSKWIPSSAIDTIIKLIENHDEDMVDSLQEFVKTLKAGEE